MDNITTPQRSVSPSSLLTPANQQVELDEEYSVRIETPPPPRLQDGSWKARFKNLLHVSSSNREATISSKKIRHKPLESRSAKVGKSGEPRFARLKQAYSAFKTLLKKIPKFFRSSRSRAAIARNRLLRYEEFYASNARDRLARYEKFYDEHISKLPDDVEGNKKTNKKTKGVFRENLDRAKEILAEYPSEITTEEKDTITSKDKSELTANFERVGSIMNNYIIDHEHVFL